MAQTKAKKDSRLKQRIGEMKRNGLVVNLFGLIPLIWSILLVLVILWGINVAVAEPNWYLDHDKSFVTKVFRLENFSEAIAKFQKQISTDYGIRMVSYWEMFWNSVWYSVGGTLMKMISTVCFAYAVARFEFKGRKLLYAFVVLQMMLPIYGQTSANFNLLLNLGLIDNAGFLLAQGAGHGMYFLITYSFFRNLPTGYAEAAKIDGAGPFRVFWSVMLPLAKPIVISLSIMQMIAYWNDYASVVIYLESFPTLSSALYDLRLNMFQLGLQTPTYFAAIIVSVIPIATLFIIFNKQIMENVSIGGLKG